MTINTADLTTQVIDGTGVFDALMHTVKLHLQEEFDSSRISGSDYTTAYIQLMGTAMQVAVQYAVSKPESDAKIAEMVATLPHIIANAESTALKTEQEIQLLWEQTMTERANTQDTIFSNYGSTTSIPVAGLVDKQKTVYQNQVDKGEQELQLLWEKTMTERANTQDTIIGSYGASNGIPVLGVIGKQKALYQNQADGYIKDAKVKAAKLFADAAMLQLNTNDTYNTSTNGFSDTNINAVMSAVKASVI